MKKRLGVLLLVLTGGLSACMTPQSYVDPQYHKASYATIHRLAQPIPAKVNSQFQRNGQPFPSVNTELQNHVEKTLRATGVFLPTTDPDAPVTISVTANNIADLAAARAKGFGTGLTFGGAGSMLDDNYEFAFSFRDATNHKYKATYQHAIHTAIGHTERPAGLTPTTVTIAFGRVIEDTTLNFVEDLQRQGLTPN